MSDYTQTNTDLVSLIERTAGVDLAKKSNHYKFGAEFWGACPFCHGGEDRFHVWPEGDRPHYWCRVCSATGSAPWFLVQYSGMSFGEACMELGLDPDDVLGNNASSPAQPTQYNSAQPPCKEWQEAGRLLVERTEKYLWHPKSPEGQKALAYLRARGFKDETIRAAHIGYAPLLKDGSWLSEPFQHWGLDPDKLTEQQRAKGCVRVPNGIVLPWFCEGQLWKIAIKRPGESVMPYGQVLGSTDGMYNVDSIEMDKPAMLVEGEFDALSVQQEAGDLIACCATGSAQKGRNPRWLADLSLASYKLIAFDNDQPDKNGLKAGDEGAHYWLQLSKSLRWSPWSDENMTGQGWRFKDANDMLQQAQAFYTWAGTDLRGWVKSGMDAYELEPITDEQWAKMRPAPAPQVVQHSTLELQPTFKLPPPQPLARVEPTREERLERFGEFVSKVVDVLGGPEHVKITPQPQGYTLEQHVKELERQAKTEAALNAWNRR